MTVAQLFGMKTNSSKLCTQLSTCYSVAHCNNFRVIRARCEEVIEDQEWTSGWYRNCDVVPNWVGVIFTILIYLIIEQLCYVMLKQFHFCSVKFCQLIVPTKMCNAIRASIWLSYVTLPFNVGRPFCLVDVSQWLHNLQPKASQTLHAYTGTIPIVFI